MDLLSAFCFQTFVQKLAVLFENSFEQNYCHFSSDGLFVAKRGFLEGEKRLAKMSVQSLTHQKQCRKVRTYAIVLYERSQYTVKILLLDGGRKLVEYNSIIRRNTNSLKCLSEVFGSIHIWGGAFNTNFSLPTAHTDNCSKRATFEHTPVHSS